MHFIHHIYTMDIILCIYIQASAYIVANGMNCRFDNEVIARVEELTMEEDAHLIADGYPKF